MRDSPRSQQSLHPKHLAEKKENQTELDFIDEIKQQYRIDEAGENYGGDWFQKHEDRRLTGEQNAGPFKPDTTRQRTLKEFFGGDDSDLSEREEADIYEHYRQQKEKLEDPAAKEAQMKIDAEELHPQMPRF